MKLAQAALRAPPLAIIVRPSFLFFFFGKLLRMKNCFPQYFGITKMYPKKNIFVCNFFLRNKIEFWAFFHGQRLVTVAWAFPSPWSIQKKNCYMLFLWTSNNWPRRLCVHHPSWPLLLPSFSLFSPSFASDPLRGNSHVRRYIQKKIFVFGNINSFTKKS